MLRTSSSFVHLELVLFAPCFSVCVYVKLSQMIGICYDKTELFLSAEALSHSQGTQINPCTRPTSESHCISHVNSVLGEANIKDMKTRGRTCMEVRYHLTGACKDSLQRRHGW